MPTETEDTIEEEAEAPSTDTCDCCGTDCDREMEGLWAEGYDNVCRECYDEIVKECSICGSDDVMPSDVSNFILAKREFTRTGHGTPRPPGIYFILGRPFYTSGLIGSGWADMNDLLFIDRLPKRDDSYEISGCICKTCARPYGKLLTDTYWMPKAELLARSKAQKHRRPDWRWLFHSYQADGWSKQREHIRQTILAHPEMLHDLEIDEEDEDYQDIREAYDLPPLRMHHEWLVLEYQGVKLYDPYSMPRRKDRISWLTTKPEPKHRGNYRPSNFSGGELPTYRSVLTEGWDYNSSRSLQALRAIFAAIKLGIIRQDGIHKKKIKPLTRKRARKVKRQIDRDIFKQFPRCYHYRHQKPKTNKPISNQYCHA